MIIVSVSDKQNPPISSYIDNQEHVTFCILLFQTFYGKLYPSVLKYSLGDMILVSYHDQILIGLSVC